MSMTEACGSWCSLLYAFHGSTSRCKMKKGELCQESQPNPATTQAARTWLIGSTVSSMKRYTRPIDQALGQEATMRDGGKLASGSCWCILSVPPAKGKERSPKQRSWTTWFHTEETRTSSWMNRTGSLYARAVMIRRPGERTGTGSTDTDKTIPQGVVKSLGETITRPAPPFVRIFA